jgi:hypothetical protein
MKAPDVYQNQVYYLICLKNLKNDSVEDKQV